MMKKILFLLVLGTAGCSFGQQLVYRPINSAFGGDPYNYTWLLNSANAQNPFSENQNQLGEISELTNLNSTLNQQLLQEQFGGDLPEVGTTSDGNFQYEVYESTVGLVINILDILTGEQSQIIVPN